jgi:pyruvate dehydrogenase E1 component beta subunit
LIPEFGEARVRVCPISEEAYVGASIGAAGSGFRPIVNPGMMTFAFTAMDQIVNQMAKIHYMFGGQAAFPIVFRASTGGGRSAAAQHSQSPHPMFMNLAGLKLVMPATPYDAKGLMKSAIRDNNPVVFFEDQILVLRNEKGPVPEEEYTIPLGIADVKRPGRDVTVIAIAKMVPEALTAAEELAGEGIEVEVVDPRTLVPMDKETLRASVQKTGRVVIVDEACITCSAAAEIAALLTEDLATFRALHAPPKRVCAPDVPIPYSPIMEQFCLPDKARIIAGIREVLA